MIENNKIEALKKHIDEAQNILITGHISPDGDALGSCIALYLFLTARSKNVAILVPNRYPAIFAFLPSIEEVIVMEENKTEAVQIIKKADLVFSMDYNSYDRVSAMKPILESSKAVKILIDHHLYPATCFNLEISYPKISSTSELLYKVICQMGCKEEITKEIAECVYLGMMTDTGNFSYNSNNPETYAIICDLIERGIDKDEIYKQTFNNFTADRLRLVGHCLANMILHPELNTAYICLTLEEQQRFNFQIGDAEGIVNMPLQIKGISKSVFLKEDKDKIKLSFRSQGDILVNIIAEQFGGGGHKNAAGGESYTTMTEAVEKLLSLLK